MHILKWPGVFSSDSRKYRFLADEISSDAGSDEQLLEEKESPRKAQNDGNTLLRSRWVVLHIACFAFYTALFLALAVSFPTRCAVNDHTQVWCKLSSYIGW